MILIYAILANKTFLEIGKLPEFGNLNSNYLYYNLFCLNASYISCFWMGILFAKEDLLIKIKNDLKLNILKDILIIITIIFLRQTGIPTTNLDFIYVPFFIIASIDLIKKSKIAIKLFEKLGKESTNMWLIHSFYCYYFFPVVKIVYYSYWAIISLVILTILSYISSKIISLYWNYITYSINTLKEIKNRKKVI